jgi:hypothetical protein
MGGRPSNSDSAPAAVERWIVTPDCIDNPHFGTNVIDRGPPMECPRRSNWRGSSSVGYLWFANRGILVGYTR